MVLDLLDESPNHGLVSFRLRLQFGHGEPPRRQRRHVRSVSWADGWCKGRARWRCSPSPLALDTDPVTVDAWARFLRASASPGSAISVFTQYIATDAQSAF